MAESESHFEHDAAHHSHLRRYVIVLVALLAGTVLTFFATAKGALVALFFMHLWDQQGANRLVFVTSLVFVALLVGLTVADNATRFPLANPPGSPRALRPPGFAPPPEGGDQLVR